MADEQSKLQIILEAVNETGSPFQDLNSSISEFQKAAEDLAKSIQESFRSISTSSSETATSIEGSVKADQTALNDFAKTASEDLQNAGSEMNNLRNNMGKGIEQIGGLIAIQQLGQSMEELGKKGEHLFDFAIEQGGDFQQTMKNIQTVISANITTHESWNQKLNDSVGITDQLQQKALDLGSRGAQSANEVAEAMDTMLRAGVDANTVLNGAAESAQNVAIVTGDKLDESANLVTEIYHQFREAFAQNGKSIQENMKETGDVLTGTLLSARINSQDFLDTLKYVGPVASQLGSSFLDTATATAVLAQNGIKGSQAGNNLKRALTSLLEPTKQGAEAMQALGLIQNGQNMLIDQSTGKMKNLTDIQEILHKSLEGLTEAQKAKYIHDMFGQYALAGTLVLANENSEAFSTLKDRIAGVSAENAASNMLDTFSGHMAQLSAHVQTVAKEFGMAFLPVLEKLIPIGQSVLNWFQSLTPASKELLMGFLAAGSAVAVFGGALATFAISAKFAGEGMTALKGIFMVQAEGEAAISIFQKLAVAIREVGIAEAFMDAMNPIGWVVLVGVAIAGVALLITQHWDSIKVYFATTWNAIQTAFSAVWDAIRSVVVDAWNYISPTIIGAVTKIQTFWNQVWPEVKEIFTAVFTTMALFLSPVIAGIGTAIVASLGFIKGAWHDAWNAIKDALKFVWDIMVDEIRIAFDVITGLFKVILDLLTGNWGKAWNDMKSLLGNVWGDIKKLFGDYVNDALSFGKDIVMGIAHGIEGAIDSVISAAKKVVSAITSIFSSAPKAPTVSSGGSSTASAASKYPIPALADGGMVSKPTLALIGEAGPEVVVPLNKLPAMPAVNGYSQGLMPPVMSGGSTGGFTHIINVYASNNVTQSEQKLGQIISQVVLGNMKLQGKIG